MKKIKIFLFALSIWRQGEKEDNPYYLDWETAWKVAKILKK
jgi:hypothetical protein